MNQISINEIDPTWKGAIKEPNKGACVAGGGVGLGFNNLKNSTKSHL